MNVTINILELASELADKELREKWDYRDGQIDIEDGQGGIMYSEAAQEIFNLFYEDYYTIILYNRRPNKTMSTNTPYEKYNYDFFMFSRIATRAYLTRTEEAEHLDIFVQLIDLYEDFVKSDFNDVDEKLEACIEQYVANLID